MRWSSVTEPIPLGDVGGAWVFPERNVLYTEASCEIPRASHAEILFDFFDWLTGQVPLREAPTLIHDWRSFTSLPAEVRRVFIDRRRHHAGVKPDKVIVAATLSPVLRMGIQTVALAAHVFVQGVRIEVVDDPGPAIRGLDLAHPDPALHARLRLAWKRRG